MWLSMEGVQGFICDFMRETFFSFGFHGETERGLVTRLIGRIGKGGL
jgi:hypothetical protein